MGGEEKREERRGEETREGRRRERGKNSTSDRRRFGLRKRQREVAACGNGREEVAGPGMLAAAKKLGLARRSSLGFPSRRRLRFFVV
ncbi:hypothetical protein B296_00028514 [Ensete ventricosum]|uniref:Uncharacterized protein n=1 Tax=Ensete ventricosum TaxID=4639 RepID=A0A426ZIP2_ENSVE|nr:hypothetical protein B296_00028514 [Ensete ventricosum]